MPPNIFGKLLREFRIQKSMLLYDMAKTIGVSSAFLSKCENGKVKIPEEWVEKLPELYSDLDKELLRCAIGVSNSDFVTEEEVESTLKDDPVPENRLMRKWLQKYPLPEKSCCGPSYGCMFCGNCPRGDYWKCPEEDKEEYEKYQQTFAEWQKRHPCLIYTRMCKLSIPEFGEGVKKQ